MSKLDTRVIQVTNVAPTTSKEQLKTLFQFIGRIREIKVFPPEGSDQQVAAKVCYIEFDDSTSAGVSLHLTNTVFIDRALIVVPVMDGKIPDEKVAMQLTPQTVARMAPGQPAWPANVVSQVAGSGGGQVISTYDPRLNALGLPQYPPLPANLDAAKVEEIRRTVYIGNLDPKTTPDNLISFFSQAGEVKYVRMAGDGSSGSRGAYLELTDQRSVATCLGYNGINFNGRTITVSHSKVSITKPLTKSQEASRREVEEAMKKVKEAQSLISAAAGGSVYAISERSRSRSRSRRRSRSRGFSRSRSRSRRRSRSRSKGRRRRTRSRSRGRKSRSPRRVRRSRTRSPRRRRSRSRSGIVVIPARERRRSRSRSKRRSRSRSRSGIVVIPARERRSRTPPRAYSGRRSRSRSRRKSPPRRRTSRSRSRGKGKDRKSKEREKKKEKKKSVSRSPSPPRLEREEAAAADSGDEISPVKRNSRDRTKSPTAPRRRKSPSRSPPPVRASRKRSGSRSPVRSARRRSPSPPRKRRSKSRSPRHSRSPAKKKKVRSPRRSRSGSRHRSKKDKKKERSRSRDRERKDKEKKKKSSKDKREDKEKDKDKDKMLAGKVVRDYDEEEKGYQSASEHEEEMRSQPGDVEEEEARSSGGDQQLVDMDTSD
ncbi:splicing regulatory glutamine/lysine-rich protein 1-like isoform X9 [Littorina saxatilis]|uniref:splicing regulatory glutamine/lysine-rich protein 1-like isoform X9 n=1 Tax=Littorina saxatilis TaxID=31220 RepID=UPI0038B440C2